MATAEEKAGGSWQSKLEKEGYAVLKGVLTKSEVDTASDLMWDWLEGLGSGLQRENADTWVDAAWPGDLETGIVTTCGAPQSPAAWYLRTRPQVVDAFASLWGTRELISSMDCLLLWRPWQNNQLCKPKTEGLHIDQNPFHKRGLQCVQGMLPLLPVNKQVGGLEVVPRSHTDYVQDIVRKNHPHLTETGDFCPVQGKHFTEAAVLVEAEPGDLILWDSRLIHGGRTGVGSMQEGQLARCSSTVCMVPRSWATPQVLEKRRLAVSKGQGTTHWPHEYREVDWVNSGGEDIPLEQPSPILKPEHWALV